MTTVLHLLATATEDGPPTSDLLEGVRRHERRRRRTRRVVVPTLSLVTAGGLAVAAISILNSGGSPETPSARQNAQQIVLAAATRTSQQSYSVQVGGWKGAFDPARNLGWFNEPNGGQIRYIGDRAYAEVVRTFGKSSLPAHIHWVSSPRMTADSNVPLAIKLLKNGAQDPQDELAALRNATTVKRSGTASGSGWTGVHYTFRLPPSKAPGVTGSVDVDSQGRVRNLDLALSDGRTPHAASHMRFGDFGIQVSVSAPPPDQVMPVEQIAPKVK